MIWTAGMIVAPDRLQIALGDRIFEHGLGLFETFRTWNGRAVLLPRHLTRLRHSAHELGIILDPASLPDGADVERLAHANALADAMIRLTVSAGRPSEIDSTVWLTAAPLPAPHRAAGYRVVEALWPVAVQDRLARHKTINYWSKRVAFEHAQALGADEAMIRSPDGRIWEGSRTSVFVVRGDELITPSTSGPIVPGVLRQVVLDQARSIGLTAVEADLTDPIVDRATEIFLTNSVRGLIPVAEWQGRSYCPASSAFSTTKRLTETIHRTLHREGICP